MEPVLYVPLLSFRPRTRSRVCSETFPAWASGDGLGPTLQWRIKFRSGCEASELMRDGVVAVVALFGG
jgi:hypothetical protein